MSIFIAVILVLVWAAIMFFLKYTAEEIGKFKERHQMLKATAYLLKKHQRQMEVTPKTITDLAQLEHEALMELVDVIGKPEEVKKLALLYDTGK